MAPPRRRGRDDGPPRSAPASPGRVQRVGTGWGTAFRPFGARVRPFVGTCALSRRSRSRRNSSRRSRSSRSGRSCTRCSRSSSRRGCCAAGRSTDRGTRPRSRAGRCSSARRPPRSPRRRDGAGVPAPRRQGAAAGRWAAAPFGRACAATPARSRGSGGGGRGARRGRGPRARRWAGSRRGSRPEAARASAPVAPPPAPVASTGFQRPARRSSSRSSSASRRFARRPKAAPVTAGGAALSGRPARDRGVRERRCHGVGGRGRGLLEGRRPAALDRVLARRDREQRRRVEALGCGDARPVAPAVGQPATDRRDRRVSERALAVVGVVGDVAGRQQQRGVRRQPGAVAGGHGGGAHPAGGAGAGEAVAGRTRDPGLRRGEHRDEQRVDVGRGPRELAVIVAQGEAGAAQVRRPAAGSAGDRW